MTEQKCKLDEHGLCSTHAPGTQGEADEHNKILDAVYHDLSGAGATIAKTGVLMQMARRAVEQHNEKRRSLGEPELRNTEREIEELLRPVAIAMVQCLDGLKALRVVGPDAS